MKKVKEFLKSPTVNITIFVLAVVLLLFSSVGGARAALTYVSEYYSTRVQMYDIGVTLEENGKAVSKRDYNSKSNGSWDEETGSVDIGVTPPAPGDVTITGQEHQGDTFTPVSGNSEGSASMISQPSSDIPDGAAQPVEGAPIE